MTYENDDKFPDGHPFANLANAVVARAAEDYVSWKLFRFRHPLKYSAKVFYGQDALTFLKSKNLMLYTNVSGAYLLKHLDIMIQEKIDEILLEEMHKNYLLQQGITKKGSKKHE